MLAHAELAQLQLTEVAQLIRAWQNPGDHAPGSTPWSLGRSLSKDYPNGVYPEGPSVSAVRGGRPGGPGGR